MPYLWKEKSTEYSRGLFGVPVAALAVGPWCAEPVRVRRGSWRANQANPTWSWHDRRPAGQRVSGTGSARFPVSGRVVSRRDAQPARALGPLEPGPRSGETIPDLCRIRTLGPGGRSRRESGCATVSTGDRGHGRRHARFHSESFHRADLPRAFAGRRAFRKSSCRARGVEQGERLLADVKRQRSEFPWTRRRTTSISQKSSGECQGRAALPVANSSSIHDHRLGEFLFPRRYRLRR
jgi:hypothetical protein